MPLSLQFFVFLLIKPFYEKICNLKRDWSQMNDISTDSQEIQVDRISFYFDLVTFIKKDRIFNPVLE